MTGHNNLSDKDIRNLLRRRLLEKKGDDDLLTQKLIDMEAKLAFSNEALEVPSLQKENELLKKLTKEKQSYIKLLVPVIILLVLGFISIYISITKKVEVPVPSSCKVLEIMPTPVNNFPVQKKDAVVLTDSAFSEGRINNTYKEVNNTNGSDSLQVEKPEKFVLGGDPGIKIDYKPGKHNPKFVDAYDNIPELSEKEKELTKKFKERMIKQLLKKDKNVWSYIPMSTGVFYGDTVSLSAFYMATSEVTNNQYRTFLNDLLIQGKIEEFMKAVPDTSKWISDGRALFYKLNSDSTKWGSNPELFFEPMRKNYYWHPAYDSYPVVNISREGAILYCDWLTNAANERIKETKPESKWESLYQNDLRIPQDIEWMMAAKGGNWNPDYPWGDKMGLTKGPQNANGCYLANFNIRNYKEEGACPNKKFPNAFNSAATVSIRDYFCVAPVMSYNPNNYNLYCLAGNVAEMVWISEKGKSGSKPGTKGGSWGSDAEHIKIEAEDEYRGITEGSIYIGFRPVFTAEVKK